VLEAESRSDNMNLSDDEDLMFSSQLSCEVTDFIAKLDAADVALREIKGEAVLKMRSLIRSLWPRAHVKPFGSFVSGLSLPTSDLDLVICMPKVHQENAPEVWTYLCTTCAY
jgi:DNA polymerase sigma